MSESAPSLIRMSALGALLVIAGAAVILYFRGAAAVSGPSIRELAGKVDLPVQPGKTVAAREKVHAGMTAASLLQVLGTPASPGKIVSDTPHDRFTYNYADGRLDITVKDGFVEQVETTIK